MALTVVLSGSRSISVPGIVRAGIKRVGVKLGPALTGTIQYYHLESAMVS